MKNIKTYESFLSSLRKKIGVDKYESEYTIDEICFEYNIKNYTINEDGSIDVDGDVYLGDHGLTELPIKFNIVNGSFDIRNNELKSLNGCPKEVGGSFICDDNELITFEGCPEKVEHDFSCISNQLTSFEGCPVSIGGWFDCGDNPINELWSLFNNYQQMELFIDLDIVREDRVIILQRLNEFLDMIGEEPVTSVEGYKCI